jgi:hypothetical protein
MEELGLTTLVTRKSEDNERWQSTTDAPNLTTLLTRVERGSLAAKEIKPEWIIVPRAQDYNEKTKREELIKALDKAKTIGGRAMIATWTTNEEEDERTQAANLVRDMQAHGWMTREEGSNEGRRTKNRKHTEQRTRRTLRSSHHIPHHHPAK